ncbi:hypothetical protein LguiB_021147 [Lonicera macranthoides]
MDPTRDTRSVKKRFSDYQEVSLQKDVGNSNKSRGWWRAMHEAGFTGQRTPHSLDSGRITSRCTMVHTNQLGSTIPCDPLRIQWGKTLNYLGVRASFRRTVTICCTPNIFAAAEIRPKNSLTDNKLPYIYQRLQQEMLILKNPLHKNEAAKHHTKANSFFNTTFTCYFFYYLSFLPMWFNQCSLVKPNRPTLSSRVQASNSQQPSLQLVERFSPLLPMERLRFLDLTNNTFGGPLPVNLSRCFNFRAVYLGRNHLVGMIPVELGSLKKLSVLYLYLNSLTGLIPTSFGNLSSITEISLAGNNIKGTIPSELSRLANLCFISLGENNLTGTIPSSLFNISTITDFFTTVNQLTGTLPANIGLTLPNLQRFGFGVNNFHGEIPGSFSNASQLQILDLSRNMLTGQVPANLGSPQNLQWFNIEKNLLGTNATDNLSFITSLSNCTNLQGLSLSVNNLGGEIQSSIGNLSIQLNELYLGYNHISGIIPAAIESLANLYILQLANNLLSGPIPNSFGKLQNLQVLALNGNKLQGQIPSSLGNITPLYVLALSDNMLEGNILASIGNCKKLNQLDLSHNNLIGPIPDNVVSIFSLSFVLNLSRNSLTGSLPVAVGRLKNINALDVSNNKFTGSIPETIAACLSLEYLYIQGNFFQGIIPSVLAALEGIRELDFSRNNLSGEIPEDIEKLPYLQYLNISFNELEGEVPKKGAFGNASAISILGNSKLCGGIEELKLPSCQIKVKKPRRHLVIIASGAALLFVLIIISIFLRSPRRRKARKDSASLDSTLKRLLRISYHELYRATAGFSPQNLIGSGSFGSIYKGKLNPRAEKLVAVKVFNLQKNGAFKSFVSECRALRNIRHRNLVKILTYCSSIDFKGNEFKALVYEFMANGSLDMWLHPQVPGSSTALSLM